MPQWVKAPAAMPDLSSTPGIHKVEEGNGPPHWHCGSAHTYTHTQIRNK